MGLWAIGNIVEGRLLVSIEQLLLLIAGAAVIAESNTLSSSKRK
jgi:hypothetical protein